MRRTKEQYSKSKIANTNKGITLLALIITIVLMLILASISVNVAINGGLFEYAGKAKHATEDVREKEFIKEAVIIAEGNSKTGRITVEEMQKAINKVAGEGVATAINNGDTVVIQYNDSKTYYEVNEKGEVGDSIEIVFDTKAGELDGTGTEIDPFVIMSIEDLVYFSQQVNSGNSYSGQYIELGKTLDFKADLSYADINTTNYDGFLGGDGETGLKKQLTNGLGFYPIGGYNNNNFFKGSFEGNGNWIKNIYINKTVSNVGLFGRVRTEGVIQNLNISGEIYGVENVGGIIGYTNNDNLKMINCNNYVRVEGTNSVGGIIGYVSGATQTSIENCNNYGTIMITETTGENVGGIAGVNGKIKGCINYGVVDGPNYVAGICGNANSAKIFECVNMGEVKGGNNVGGIYGTSGNGGLAEKCYNSGQITGQRNVGGIAGHHYRSGCMKCVYNTGKIIGVENAGGIAGDCSNDWGRNNISSKCYNTGDVTGTTNVGQTIGKISTASSAYYEKMYYLNTTSNKGIGNMDDIEGIVEGKTAAELKADALLSVLNGSHTHNVDGTDVDYTAKCWVKDTKNINSGYPIFSFQTQADNSQ